MVKDKFDRIVHCINVIEYNFLQTHSYKFDIHLKEYSSEIKYHNCVKNHTILIFMTSFVPTDKKKFLGKKN